MIISKDRLLLAGLLIGVLLILIVGLGVAVKRKPKQAYTTTDWNGALGF
jgi:hypothetical protein